MGIEIDVRESKVIALLTGIDHSVKQLNLGDINITNDGKIMAIIERKTIADMAASLKDGRWKEQKLRLLQERETSGALLIYVIEGSYGGFNEEGAIHGVSSKALVTMFMNTMFRDRIFVVKTTSIIDTVDFIKGFTRRILESSREWCEGRKELCLDSHQDAIIKAKKNDNVTCDTVFSMQLCSIPGISTKKMNALRSEFKSVNMCGFIDTLRSCGDQKCMLQMLMGVNGIGKVLAHDILHHLGFVKK